MIAVYVYDNPDGQDYMKVVFNYAGSKNTVEIPLDPSVIDNVENIETGAVRLSSAQVHQSNADKVYVRFFFMSAVFAARFQRVNRRKRNRMTCMEQPAARLLAALLSMWLLLIARTSSLSTR